MGMPVNDFVDQAYTGLCGGEDTVFIGDLASGESVLSLAHQRRAIFDGLAKVIRSHKV